MKPARRSAPLGLRHRHGRYPDPRRPLYKAKAIIEADVVAAVDAYLDDPVTGDFPIGAYTLDLAAAVLASKFAADLLARPEATNAGKRNAVRTALLLATPVKMKR